MNCLSGSFKIAPLTPPNNEKKVILHSCCAPCSGAILEEMVASGIEVEVFFYNPNIHPREEYNIRKKEIIRFAKKRKIAFTDADYDTDDWFKRVKGLEEEPERGKRCTACFDMRMERTALFASQNHFKVFTSSLGISRWKDRNQVNDCGTRAASRHPGLAYWTYNWRKSGGTHRAREIVHREQFYQQQYCGCIYSRRDTNLRRLESVDR